MTEKIIAYHLDARVICPDCYAYWRDRLTTAREDEQSLITLMKAEPATFDALPDGFTCAVCETFATVSRPH
jgi:rubredoxin